MNNLDVKRLDDGDYSPQEIVELFVQFQWQPIETAPKDGTFILAYQSDVGVVTKYFIVAWSEMDSSFNTVADWRIRPTHWMPLQTGAG